jgi:hypothetical protein
MTLVDTALSQALSALKLSGMLETLGARLAQARAGELGHLDFLRRGTCCSRGQPKLGVGQCGQP